ncbi:hypothetical protein [Laceyella sacchari]|uniref:hypothetical protein n=1 Tax=Laceyella sacchari TaxID=37482 RepID=UPI0010492844|nr:hypothetical protein [Laceyella sacchari]
MDEKMKQLVIESIHDSKEETIEHFRFLLQQYPYHADTRFVVLEVRGHRGDFSVDVSAMAGWEEQLMENAYVEHDSDLGGFEFSSLSKLNRKEILKELDVVEEIDAFTKDYLVPFFQECFNETGGKSSKIPYYLFYPNSGETYDLIKESWIDPSSRRSNFGDSRSVRKDRE